LYFEPCFKGISSCLMDLPWFNLGTVFSKFKGFQYSKMKNATNSIEPGLSARIGIIWSDSILKATQVSVSCNRLKDNIYLIFDIENNNSCVAFTKKTMTVWLCVFIAIECLRFHDIISSKHLAKNVELGRQYIVTKR
jgi:hypothetical protein